MEKHMRRCEKNPDNKRCPTCSKFVSSAMWDDHKDRHTIQRDELRMRRAHLAARNCSDKAKVLHMEADHLRAALVAKHERLALAQSYKE